jgi:sialate O-acetylesterase
MKSHLSKPRPEVRRRSLRTLVLAPALFAAAHSGRAAESESAIDLGPPFSDHAILQRQMPVPVWGWSDPGTKITVKFAGQEKRAEATGENGKWIVELDPLEASAEPREMSVSDQSGRTVTLENILVGEVWVASGQSNMQWVVGKSRAKDLVDAITESGDAPPIRECKITDRFAALHPIERARGAWTDGEYLGQSAIAFAFAHKLYEELGVPIGILNGSFSQTRIEAWVPRGGFADGTDEHSREMHRRMLETDPRTPEHRVAWDRYEQDVKKLLESNAERVREGRRPRAASEVERPGNLDGNRDASWLFNARLNPMIPYAIRGAIWNQGYANMGDGLTYYHNLHALIRGWRREWNRPDLPVYFHQFYSPNPRGTRPSIGSTAEMRLGTWLARDIPHTGMASQIDIEGAIHYRHKVVPARRLALHALKNQYDREVVADGPMFESYRVDGERLIVEFDHADGGLVVAETRSNALGKDDEATGFADPEVIPDGEDQVDFFYLAGEDRVWHPAEVEIDGSRVILTSSGVRRPRGVAYGTGGIGFRPALYNRARLPMTPFIHYDGKRVTRDAWPDEQLKIAGEKIDPSTVGMVHEYRKMPLLSTQFRDRAVLQAGTPITFWGSAVHAWGYEADGEAVITFRFDGIEKTIPVTPGMREWQHTVPAMEPGAAPKTLEVTFEIDGELVHRRVAEDIVVGDVWYVATPPLEFPGEAETSGEGIVRVMEREAKRSSFHRPSRFSVAVSTTPKNRFASYWKEAGEGFAGALGRRLAAETGNPVGIILMESREDVPVKSWIPPESLKLAPGLMEDYEEIASLRPGNRHYDANVRNHLRDWEIYWSETIPEMIAAKRPTDGAAWGRYPTLAADVTSEAAHSYNVMVHSFTPAEFRGILFLAGEAMMKDHRGADFGPELAALANGWKRVFGGDDVPFVYTLPTKSLVPRVSRPDGMDGRQRAIEISDWPRGETLPDLIDEFADRLLEP